eukprot:Pgem_evm1s15179
MGPAIMYKDQYKIWCKNHLNIVFYTKLDIEYPNLLISRMVKAVNKFLELAKTLLKNNNDNEDILKTLRPIVSCTKTPLTGLSKWVHFHLWPIAQNTESIILNSEQFIKKLKNINIPSNFTAQNNGLPMGHPCAPSIAVLYLAFYELTIWDKLINSLVFYTRYIDDGFVIIKNTDLPAFKRLFNDIPGLRWDVSIINGNHPTPFLDVNVCINND